MKQEGNGAMDINEFVWKIRHLKEEAKKFSWLLGEELTRKIVEVLEEKKTTY